MIAYKTRYRIPKAFFWRRLHSLMGLWLVFFLIIHLFSNSQAAMLIGDNGAGFIKAANDIRNLPYLPLIEIGLLAIPFLIHTIWGIQYALTGKFNSYSSDGREPSLSEFPRNHAYTWQRITSWVLIILIGAHVYHMRYLEYPTSASMGADHFYMVRVQEDPGLATVSQRLGVSVYTPQQAKEKINELFKRQLSLAQDPLSFLQKQEREQTQQWISAFEMRSLENDQRMIVSKDFGTAELFMLRDTFKRPAMLTFYTFLVLFSCYHAFNGFWTFFITWGVTLSPHSQRLARRFSSGLMAVITFFGLAAIWGTYWINLKH